METGPYPLKMLPVRPETRCLATIYLPRLERGPAGMESLDHYYNTRIRTPWRGSFLSSGVPQGTRPWPLGRKNDLTCWNRGSDICVSMLYVRHAVSRVNGGWL